QAMLSPVREWQAEAAGSESPLPRVPQDPARTKNGFCKQREGHPYKIFFLLLRPSGVLCGVPSHPAITAAAVLFSELPARSGAKSRAKSAGRHFVLSSSSIKKSRSGTGISPTRTSLRATEGSPPGTRAPAAGFAGRSRSAGPHRGGAGGCRRLVRGDRRLQAGSRPAAPGPRHRRGELLAGGRSRGLDRHPLDANRRAGNGAGAKLVAGGTSRTLCVFTRGTGPALWAFGQLGEPAAGTGPRAPRENPGARP